MAITNAQQYQQLVNKRADGKRPGYRGDDAYGGGTTAGGDRSNSPGDRGDGPATGYGANTARERGITQQYKGPSGTTGDIRGRDADPKPPTEFIGGREFKVNPTTKEEQEKKNFAIALENDRRRIEARKQKLKDIAILDNLGKLGYTRRTKDTNLVDLGVIDPQTPTIGGYAVPSLYTGIPAAFTVDPATDYFDIDSPREIASTITTTTGGITGVQANTLGDLRQDIQMEDRLNDPTDTVTQSEFEEYMNRNKIEDVGGGGGGDTYVPPIIPQVASTVDQEPELSELEKLLANRGLAYRFMADGGRAGFMDGGIMSNNDLIGGLADGSMDEMGRQMYGLGKLVKKATGAIKKIVKSPVGKAALAFGMYKFGAPLFKSEGFKNFFLKDASKKFALSNLSNKGILAGIGGISALSGLMSQPEEDEEEQYYRGEGLDIAKIRANPYDYMGPAYRFRAAEGGNAEPVAKDTMPLLDMNGMEKDYRADGGFVPIGRMERADDVPARLSKNEFVFTADAVRNAGDGDVDKGAEVMYNMMKNLESGGKVSEESQGLDGARDMFQTSKRLEEVL